MHEDERVSTRHRILDAAARLLREEGRSAVSTRAVSREAGVQAPTIYRQFGDMSGLLDAVAKDGFDRYLEEKTSRPRLTDPLDDLRAGWDLHVEFGLANPGLYALMYGEPRPGTPSPAADEAQHILIQLVQSVADAGRLTLPVDNAVHLVSATGIGVVLTLIASKVEDRDTSLSATAREAVLAAITSSTRARRRMARVQHDPVWPAPIQRVLSPAEKLLLLEWIGRMPAS